MTVSCALRPSHNSGSRQFPVPLILGCHARQEREGSVTADSAPDMRPPHEPEASFHPPSLEVSLISSQPVAGLKVQYNANIVKDAEEADIPNTPSARV